MTAKAIKDLTENEAPEHGELSYNGIKFNAFRRFDLQSEAVYDEANWAVTHMLYTLSVAATIFADDESDMAILSSSYKEALNESGKQLILKGAGLGELVVNDGTGGTVVTHRDVDWGPKPRVMKWNAVGGLQAYEVEWTCTFAISECAAVEDFEAQGGERPLLALNYEGSYSTQKGLTTRVITGYAQIPLTRSSGAPSVSSSADDFWASFNVAVPAGFNRVGNSRTVSPNQTRLNFSFTDEQLPGDPYPEGCTFADAEYTLGNRTPKSFEQWNGSLEGTFEVAPGVSKAKAAAAYYGILLSTLNNLTAAARDKDSKAFVIVDRIIARNSLFTRRASFSATFMATGCLEAVLGPGGLWAPVGTNYATWAASMASVWGNRGTSQLRHASGAIISLCSPTKSVAVNAGVASPSLLSGSFEGIIEPDIPEDGGYLAYDCQLVAVRKHSTSSSSSMSSYDPSGETKGEGTGLKKVPAATTKPEIQINGAPTDTVLLTGKAMRVKHLPEIPQLTGVDTDGGKIVAYEQGAMIEGPRIVGCYFGAKVYFVKWAIQYKLDGFISQIPEQPQKTGCCDDEAA